MGPIASTANGRVMEAYVSAHLLNHEISFGKQDDWLGPGLGGGMAYSNNAENIYSFRINRVEPLHIPLLSRLTGPFRYDFLVGKLRGHTYMPNPANPGGTNPNLPNVINPGDPWVHIEKISFRPTENLEFGFERTVIWGGKGHAPITLRTFLKSFISLSSPGGNDQGRPRRSRRALWRLRLLLPAALRPQLAHALHGLRGARRRFSRRRSPPRRLPARHLSLPCARHSPAGPARRSRLHRPLRFGPSSPQGLIPQPLRPVHVLGRHPEAGLHQPGPTLRRLDRARGQGRTGMGDLASERQRMDPGGPAQSKGHRLLHPRLNEPNLYRLSLLGQLPPACRPAAPR